MTRPGGRRARGSRTKPRRRDDASRPARRSRDAARRRPGGPGRPASEVLLRSGILAGIGLVAFTPLVVTPDIVYPFVVGKALWSRAVIEIVFVLWVALALVNPAYRPPRSPLLILLAAGLAVSLLAAVFGVGVQRSMWSSYERMQGVVNLAHWLAFAVVLVSVLRTGREWRALLGLNLVAGAGIALIVVARHHDVEVPFYGELPERERHRLGGPFGNPVYLGAYMAVNMMIALGLAARSWLGDAGEAPVDPPERHRFVTRGRAGCLGWAAVAALHLRGLDLAGSTGSYIGLAAGLGFAVLAAALLARGRWRAALVVPVVAMALAAATVVGLHVADPDGAAARWTRPVLTRLSHKLDIRHPTVQSRLAAWETAAAGFAERPLLGWGPENFDVVFGRFASGYGATMEPHDKAHGQVFEVAATTGAFGLVAWLALWSVTFLALWRAAIVAGRGEQALIALAGAALAAHLVQTQALFDTAASSLQHALLLAFVAGLRARPTAGSGTDDGRIRDGGPAHGATGLAAAALDRRVVRVGVPVAVLALGVAGLATNAAIYGGARELFLASTSGEFLAHFRRSVARFEPLASEPRKLLFNNVAPHWKTLHATRPEQAKQLLALMDAEAEAAIAAQPLNWRLHHALARMYHAVAAEAPVHAERARAQLARARELAPNRRVFRRAVAPPQALESSELAGGRHELRWRGSDGAGYHEVRETRAGGSWRTHLYTYDPALTSFVPPAAGDAPGPRHFLIRACDYPGRCSAWAEWPPLPAPAAELGGAQH